MGTNIGRTNPDIEELDTKENIYPSRVSSIDRNKLMKTSSKFESKIPVSTNSIKSVIGKLNMIENGQNLRLTTLNKNIETCQQEISQYSTKIMTFQTQKANYEFEAFKLDNEYSKLKQMLAVVEDQISELKHHEAESLKEIVNKYDSAMEAMTNEHEDKVHQLTEKYSSMIEKQIHENVLKHKETRQILQEECVELERNNKDEEKDMNRKLIRLNEEYGRKFLSEIQKINESISRLQNEVKLHKDEIINKKRKIKELEDTNVKEVLPLYNDTKKSLNDLNCHFSDKDDEINALKLENSEIESQISQIRSQFNLKANKIDRLLAETKILNEELANEDYRRRTLHNKIQDLKGNIRVFCRIRPPKVSSVNCDNYESMYFKFEPNSFNLDAKVELKVSKEPISENQSLTGNSLHNQNSSLFNFQFDQVISDKTSNEEIFEELSQLVQSVLDGYNVCIFAYGQTGSGKTWTMSHPETGMIPLSICKIFSDIESLKVKNWQYKISGQFIEIYNENIVDLLSPLSGKKHEIKHNDDDLTTNLTNVTSVPLNSIDQVMEILGNANKNRSTASTKSNERSSRSHLVSIFKIEGQNSKTGEICRGNLNLIDLAGSERLNHSQATGDRMKETQSINKSLSSLGDVIHALGSKKSSYIPYRNSKLTYLLKNSLGGNSKVLMFVNISPLLKNYSETINSLRFASKVNNTKTT